MVDFHIVAVAALRLQRDGVHRRCAEDVRHAHLLVVVAALDVEHHGAIYARRNGIHGGLYGGVVASCANGVDAVSTSCYADVGCNILRNSCLSAVYGECRQFCRSLRAHGGIALHVVGYPEVVHAIFGHGVGARNAACALRFSKFLHRCKGRLGASGVNRNAIQSRVLRGFDAELLYIERRVVAHHGHGHVQHLHVLLACHHVGWANVGHGVALHLEGLLQVALHLNGEVGTGVGALAHVFDGDFAIGRVRYDGIVELSRSAFYVGN